MSNDPQLDLAREQVLLIAARNLLAKLKPYSIQLSPEVREAMSVLRDYCKD